MMTMNRLAGALLLALCTTAAVAQTAAAPAATAAAPAYNLEADVNRVLTTFDVPGIAIAVVKERDGIINAQLEERRLKLAIDSSIVTADAKAEGFGDVAKPRLALMASQVADAFQTKGRINPDAVWNGSFLPTAADRNIFKK